MRSILTGYVRAFSRRYHRVGQLFRKRYKSVVVEEEPFPLEPDRCLHLNPVLTNGVPNLGALDRYP